MNRPAIRRLSHLMVATAATAATLTALAPAAHADGPTTFSNDNLIVFPDFDAASPYPSEITVSGMSGFITDVDVVLKGITHGNPDDIDLLLVGPGDKGFIKILSDAGGTNDLGGFGPTITIDDSAAGLAPDNGGFVDGASYQPTDYQPMFSDAWSDEYDTLAAAYNGRRANGTWKLYGRDDTFEDFGDIDGWALKITTGNGTQTVSFSSNPGSPTASSPDYQAQASGGGSGNPVVYSRGAGTTNNACTVSSTGLVDYLHVGTCQVVASQAGNFEYNPGSATQTITVGQATQTITFTTAPPTQASIGTSHDINATGGTSGNPVVYSVHGSTTNNACTVNASTGVVQYLRVGSCVIAANQAGNSDFAAAPQKLYPAMPVRNGQTINTANLPDYGLTGQPAPIYVTGGASGNPVVISSTTPAVCTVSNDTVTYNAPGTCTLSITQNGSSSYWPASTTHNISVYRLF